MGKFVRENIYRLQISNKQRVRQFLCLEFIKLVGAPAVSAWIETEIPREYDKAEEQWKGGYTEQSEKSWVYGNQVLEKKRLTNADMAAYAACKVLAKEGVLSTEAGALVQLVLQEWFIKGPKAQTKHLRQAAPEWWALASKSKA